MDKCDDSVLDNIRPDSSARNSTKSSKQLNQNSKSNLKSNGTKSQQNDSQSHSTTKNKKAKRLPWNTQVIEGKFEQNNLNDLLSRVFFVEISRVVNF